VVALCAKIQQVIDASGAVDLVVLPELCTIEYGTDAFAHLDVLAEPANGSSSQAFAQLACNTAAMVVFGLAQFRRHPGDGKPSLPTEPEPGRGPITVVRCFARRGWMMITHRSFSDSRASLCPLGA